MITRFKQQINMPYSLHDMVVNNITYKNEFVYLKFEHGFVSTEEPYTQVEGKITIENVDMDSACVLLLSKLGKYDSFDGMKISLNDFIKQYDDVGVKSRFFNDFWHAYSYFCSLTTE